jgi:maltose/moltooligosaccharide transporter
MINDQIATVPASSQSTMPRVPLATALLFSVANVGANLVFGFFNFVMPLYLSNSYHLPAPLVGLLANERSFVGGFIQPFVGRLSDRTRTRLGRRRPFFLVGVPLMALALLVLGLHPPFAVMIAVVPIAGFFLFIAFDPYLAMMADMTPPEQRGQVGGFLAVAAMLGTILVNLVALFLWTEHEFAVFLLTVGGLVITFGITFVTVREPPHPIAAPQIPRNPLRYLGDVLHHRELTKYIIALGLFYLGSGGATPFVTLFATKALGVSDRQAFLLVIVIVGCTALGAVPAGLLADRVGKKPVLIVGLALFSVGALVGSQVPSVQAAILPMILVGLGNACPTALSIPLLADLIPVRRMGEFIGLGSFVWSIAQPIGSLCAGALVTSAIPSTYRHAFIWAGILMACAAVVMLTVRPAKARATLAIEDATLPPAPALGDRW